MKNKYRTFWQLFRNVLHSISGDLMILFYIIELLKWCYSQHSITKVSSSRIKKCTVLINRFFLFLNKPPKPCRGNCSASGSLLSGTLPKGVQGHCRYALTVQRRHFFQNGSPQWYPEPNSWIDAGPFGLCVGAWTFQFWLDFARNVSYLKFYINFFSEAEALPVTVVLNLRAVRFDFFQQLIDGSPADVQLFSKLVGGARCFSPDKIT